MFVHLFYCVPVCQRVCLSASDYVLVCLRICQSASLSVCIFVCMCLCLSANLSVYVFVCRCLCLSANLSARLFPEILGVCVCQFLLRSEIFLRSPVLLHLIEFTTTNLCHAPRRRAMAFQ